MIPTLSFVLENNMKNGKYICSVIGGHGQTTTYSRLRDVPPKFNRRIVKECLDGKRPETQNSYAHRYWVYLEDIIEGRWQLPNWDRCKPIDDLRLEDPREEAMKGMEVMEFDRRDGGKYAPIKVHKCWTKIPRVIDCISDSEWIIQQLNYNEDKLDPPTVLYRLLADMANLDEYANWTGKGKMLMDGEFWDPSMEMLGETEPTRTAYTEPRQLLKGEEWRTVEYMDLDVSNLGRVRNTTTKSMYYDFESTRKFQYIIIERFDKRWKIYTHSIVRHAFSDQIKCPADMLYTSFKDGDPTNCRVSNIKPVRYRGIHCDQVDGIVELDRNNNVVNFYKDKVDVDYTLHNGELTVQLDRGTSHGISDVIGLDYDPVYLYTKDYIDNITLGIQNVTTVQEIFRTETKKILQVGDGIGNPRGIII